MKNTLQLLLISHHLAQEGDRLPAIRQSIYSGVRWIYAQPCSESDKWGRRLVVGGCRCSVSGDWCFMVSVVTRAGISFKSSGCIRISLICHTSRNKRSKTCTNAYAKKVAVRKDEIHVKHAQCSGSSSSSSLSSEVSERLQVKINNHRSQGVIFFTSFTGALLCGTRQ